MISVLITVHNEEKLIERTIKSIYSQMDLFDYEIIVVASGCTDNTVQILYKIKKWVGNNLIIIVEKERTGKPNAIRIARNASKGNLLILCDGDIVLGKASIPKLLYHFNNPKIALVAGRVIPQGKKENFLFKLSTNRCLAWHCLRMHQNRNNENVIPSGYLYSIRKDSLVDIPEYIINDDLFIGLRNKENLSKAIYEPDACVFPIYPQNLADYIKQRRRTQLGREQLISVYPSEIKRIQEDLLRFIKMPCCTGLVKEKPAAIFNYILQNMLMNLSIENRSDLNKLEINLWNPILSTKTLIPCDDISK